MRTRFNRKVLNRRHRSPLCEEIRSHGGCAIGANCPACTWGHCRFDLEPDEYSAQKLSARSLLSRMLNRTPISAPVSAPVRPPTVFDRANKGARCALLPVYGRDRILRVVVVTTVLTHIYHAGNTYVIRGIMQGAGHDTLDWCVSLPEFSELKREPRRGLPPVHISSVPAVTNTLRYAQR